MTRDELLYDDSVIWLHKLADGGDSKAVLELHAFLAQCLEQGNDTPLVREILIGMHKSMAKGIAADVAMMSKPSAGRPRNDLRDDRIYGFVQSHVTWWDMLDFRRAEIEKKFGPKPARPTMESIYKEAAVEFGLHWTTIKRIHLAMKKAARARS
jgi:hypothetical protein